MPKDLGVRFGTETQAIWEGVEKECKVAIEQLEKSIIIQKAILELAQQKIAIEKESLK